MAAAATRGTFAIQVAIVSTWAAAGFGVAVALRSRLYEDGWRAVCRAPGPVVSVGNLAFGGQGKTPLVALLARWFLDAGARPAVVSRGYGRRHRGPVLVSDGSGPRCSAREGGDEPVMLARRTAAVVIADADRVRGAQAAFREHRADVVLLDDGFQHRRLHRDLDVVVMSEPPPQLFPAGRGREPPSALARADVAFIIEPGWERRAEFDALVGARAEPIHARLEAVDHVDASGSGARPLRELAGRRAALLTGVARPHRVARTLDEVGVRVVLHEVRRDHARLSHAGRAVFSRRAAASGAELELTTEKDAARWDATVAGMRAVRVELRLDLPDASRLAGVISRTTGISLRPEGSARSEPARAST